MRKLFQCEQLKKDLSIIKDYDQVLKKQELLDCFENALGKENIEFLAIGSSQYNAVIYQGDIREHLIVFKAVSYLGHPHGLDKKRIQIGEVAMHAFKGAKLHPRRTVHIVGVYHYEGLVMFVDFDIADKENKKYNNSSLHVHVIDLYLGLKTGCFYKVDKNNNGIYSIPSKNLKKYFDRHLEIIDTI